MPRRSPARCGCRTSSRVHGNSTGADNRAMKVLNLQCAHRHSFEGWFGSDDEFQSQLAAGLIECPLCGDTGIAKLPSAPPLNLGAQPQPAPKQDVATVADADMQRAWLKMVRHVMANTEDV